MCIMSWLINEVRTFGHFLWSGSFDPALEKRIDPLNVQRMKVRDIVKTTFVHNDYTFMHAKNIRSRLYQEPIMEISPTHSKNTGKIHGQVILECPNFTHQTNTYKQLYTYARIGKYGTA